ncbi:MAG: ABC transporter ATP-binding protein [Burkholderiales bacterium]
MSSSVAGVAAAGVEARAEPAPRGAAIAVRGLGKRYEMYARPHHRLLQMLMRGRRNFFREFWALRNVSFEIARGETVGIVGRNGSGKSTLLQLITGTLNPTEGAVEVHGRIAALLELGSGFNPEFTGRENVFLNGAILGISRSEMQAAMASIEDFAGIGDFIDQPVKQYSSGMMVRLAFSVAIHVTPDILLVDETLAVGDVAFQSKCLDRIRRLQEGGTAILLVSHAPNTIIEFCSRAVYLDHGSVVNVGPCREVLEQYANDLVTREGGIAIGAAPASVADAGAASAPARVEASVPSAVIDAPPATEIAQVRVLDASGVATACVSNGEVVDIAIDAVFHRANAAPCLGMEIKTTDDIVLWSATTQYMGLRPRPAAAGERRRYVWRIRADFGGQRYVIALGIGDVAAGEYRRHSRLHYAGHFDVLPEARRGTGYLEPRVEFVDGRAD